MGWFDDVTGSNDYERQSWRDSYNGGKAAGDFTGNHNQRLDNEREAFGGATWSGSSSQPSAIEWAQMGGGQVGTPSSGVMLGPEGLISVPRAELSSTRGPGVSGAGTAGGTSPTKGPGSVAVSSGATQGPGTPAGAAVSASPRRTGGTISFQIPMDSPSAVMPIFAGGKQLAQDRGWSNMGDVEERLGDPEFLSPGWFMSWGVASADGWAMANVNNGGPLKTDKIQKDLYEAPGVIGGWAKDFGGHLADRVKAANDPFGPDHPSPGFSTGGF